LKTVVNWPTWIRSISFFMGPLRSVKEDVNDAVSPNQVVLPTFAKCAVQSPLPDPLVDRLGTDLQQGGDLLYSQDGREMRTATLGERLGDLGF
jgi:hypothetical protein